MTSFFSFSTRTVLAQAAVLALQCLAADAALAQSADSAATQKLEAVEVTGQSRSQQLQNVPIAMQVMSGAALEKLGASTLADVDVFIPGLAIDASQATRPNIYMRGVGTQDFGIGTDSPVGIYLNGVYSGKTGGALLDFNDVKRVEVLKGPQGTLFGRNAAAGAISIVTNDPSAQYEVDGMLRLGNQGTRHIELLYNAPVGEDVAFRFTAVDQHSDGWIRNQFNGVQFGGDNSWGTRAALRWSGDTTSVNLTWEHEEMNEPGPATFSMTGGVVNFGAPSTWVSPFPPVLNNDASPDVQSRRFDGVTLRVEHSLPFAELTSITAYRGFTSQNYQDNDASSNPATFFSANNVESNSTWQQEFKLNGKTALVDWLAGASAYHESATQANPVSATTTSLDTLFNHAAGVAPFALLTQIANQLGAASNNVLLTNVNLLGQSWTETMHTTGGYSAYAVYGDAIWHLDPATNLTTGVRFTHDSKTFSWLNPLRSAPGLDAQLSGLTAGGFFTTVSALAGAGQLGPLTPQTVAVLQHLVSSNIEFNNPGTLTTPYQTSASWNNTSPRLVLDHHFGADHMVYGSWTEGYQSGGFNAVDVNGRYNPEYVTNWELGAKGQLRDLGLSYDASAFHYAYTNLQDLVLVQNANAGIPGYQVVNSDQHADGLDLGLQWQIDRTWRLTGTGEYIDQTYSKYTTPTGINLTGQPVGTPKFSGTAGVAAAWGMLGGMGNFNLTYGYVGPQRCNTYTTGQGTCFKAPTFQVGEAEQRVDTRLGWNAPSNKWGVALLVNNLTNNQYIHSVSALGEPFGSPYAYLTKPRMAAIEFNAKL